MTAYDSILTELNALVWDAAELKFGEQRSADAFCSLMKREGFSVTRGLAGMPTAFTASYGSGHPVIGLLAEYDALDGLSQQSGVAKPAPRAGTTCGHGCGHNLLGVGAAGATLLVKDHLCRTKGAGTVVLIGCPGEEGGSGKAYLARAGVFDGLDAALTWHPGGSHGVMTGSMQANCQAYFRFSGVASHAAAAPHLGRSALDAVELMDVGVNYLREHMEPTDRIHYAITDTGGVSPNVVQSHAEVLYLIRSTETEKAQALYERVCRIAQGAALMTDATLSVHFDKACSNTLSNAVLEQLLYENMCRVPLPVYTQAELDFAGQIQQTFPPENLASDISLSWLSGAAKRRAMEVLRPLTMANAVAPHQHLDTSVAGSSDVGDCSHVTPTAQFISGCFVPGTPGHSWQMVAQGKSGTAVKGMLYAAQVLAGAVQALLDDPALLAAARREFEESTGGKPYACPIPPQVAPHAGRPD